MYDKNKSLINYKKNFKNFDLLDEKGKKLIEDAFLRGYDEGQKYQIYIHGNEVIFYKPVEGSVP